MKSFRSQPKRQTDQWQVNVSLVSWTDKDAVILGERHQILWQSKNNKPGRVADLAHVLILLYIHD